METIYLLLLVIVIILILTGRSSLNTKIKGLEFRLHEIQGLLTRLTEKKAETGEVTSAAPVWTVPPAGQPSPPVREAPPIPVTPPPAITPEISVPDLPEPEIHQPVMPEEEVFAEKIIFAESAIPRSIIEQPIKQAAYEQPVYRRPAQFQPAEKGPSFFERHPDLEKFIGENLINKIGIAILVLAIGYFVKFAIDSNWIGPVGRVGIGVLCGAILIGIAHRMRNSYTAFSSVLVGGGLAVLYFTITLAYHQFHLFNQVTSFIVLIVITCFAVILSILYDKQELAIIALVGGLVSPLMVSTGHANYHGLFIYLVILNAGLLVIAYYKSWRILNIAAFGLTVLMFSAILFGMPVKESSTGFLYTTILYLLFFAINVAHNVKENKAFIASDFTILLTNTALYFGAGLYLLTAMHHEELRGLFALSLGVINLLLSYLLFRNKKVDNNILYLLIGITLTFISLTGPLQLHGHYITLFWAAETVLLYWLYQKSAISLMKLSSRIIWVVMLVSLFIDWCSIYGNSIVVLNVMANKGFITTLAAGLSSYLLFILNSKKAAGETEDKLKLENGFKFTAFILLFLSGFLEINFQFSNRYPQTSLNTIYLMLYLPAFIYIFYALSKKISVMKVSWKISAILMVASIFLYLIFIQDAFYLQHDILVAQNVSALHFAAHWAGAVFTGLLLYQLINILKSHISEGSQKLLTWSMAVAIIIFLSMEVSLISNLLFYSKTNSIDHIEDIFVKTGLPVLWGLLSFAMMWLGMRHKVVSLRIISLTLFGITLLKLFIFDIRNIPPAGKIAAFFCLGILLLIISFMYQKVKKIIVADETKITADDEAPKED